VEACRPWLCAFELPRKADEGRLRVEARRRLHPDGEHLLVPVERNRHRQLAGGVEHCSERCETEGLLCPISSIAAASLGPWPPFEQADDDCPQTTCV